MSIFFLLYKGVTIAIGTMLLCLLAILALMVTAVYVSYTILWAERS